MRTVVFIEILTSQSYIFASKYIMETRKKDFPSVADL